MPFNGVGIFEALPPPDFPAVPDTVIRADSFNRVVEDLHEGLSTTMPRDGQGTMTGHLRMGGKKVTGLATGTLPGDAVSYEQITVDATKVWPAGTLNQRLKDQFWNPCDKPWLAPRDGVSDATAKFQDCIDAAAAAGAGVMIPPGHFKLNSLVLRTNTQLVGSGRGRTFLHQASGANDLMHAQEGSSTGVAGNTRNIIVAGLTMQGTLPVDGFQEVLHLFFVSGVSDLLITDCDFLDWRGDAIYIGTGNERGQNPGQVRHNERVTIRNNRFNGGSSGVAPLVNRNGVSIIDCTTGLIEGNYFTRCSQSGMPGCVDIEPDGGGSPGGTSAILRDIIVRQNTAYDNFGASGFALNFPNDPRLMTTKPKAFSFIGNEIQNPVGSIAYSYMAGISLNSLVAANDLSPLLDILVEDNGTENVLSPFVYEGVRDVLTQFNRWGESLYSCRIGNDTGTRPCLDMSFKGNTFTRVAQDNGGGGNAVFVFCGERIHFTDENVFFWCGKANDTYNANIVFSGPGLKSDLWVENNVFIARAVNGTSWSVRNDTPSSVSAGLNRYQGNKLVNILNGPEGFVHDYMANIGLVFLGLENSWQNFGAPFADAAVFKDAAGVVHINCTVKNGAISEGSTIFKIPPKFRPGHKLKIVVTCGTALGIVEIEESVGDLVVRTLPSNAEVSISASYHARA